MNGMRNRRTDMRAMRVERFSGYEGLKLVDLQKPAVSDGKVLLRMTAAGVTPLDHTILSGQFPLAKMPGVGRSNPERAQERQAVVSLKGRLCGGLLRWCPLLFSKPALLNQARLD